MLAMGTSGPGSFNERRVERLLWGSSGFRRRFPVQLRGRSGSVWIKGSKALRRAAMAFGMALVRTWPSSSCSVTSRRQSSRFSISYHPAGAPVGRRGRPAGAVDW